MVARRQTLTPPTLPGYTYVRPLGSGGFADVFLYQQNMPRRLVAVKVLLGRVQDDPMARALVGEADIMASLSAHPAILTVYEASVAADGRPFLVMEYCPTSLTNRYRSEKIPVAEVLSIGIKITAAVESAHRSGLLHRDIKPANILVTTYGHPVLSDFGVATGGLDGTDDVIAMSPPWSAPEVVERRSSGTVASEVWALGATIYTLLAQRSPFDIPGRRRSDEQLKARIVRARVGPTGRDDVPQSLERALADAMRRDPADRYPSALAFGQALQEVQRELGLAVTAIELPTDEWARIAAPGVDDGAPSQTPRGPVRSTVPVESRRAGTGSDSRSHDVSNTGREERMRSLGRGAVVAIIIGGAALVGVLITLVLLAGS